MIDRKTYQRIFASGVKYADARIRNEALEEAARVADGYCTDRTDDVAAGIRALKSSNTVREA